VKLEANEVHLWLSHERAVEAATLQRAIPWLEARELAELEQRQNVELALRYLRTRALQRAVLARYLPGVEPAALRYVVGELGKPELAPQFASAGVYFNLTHTEGLVALAVSRQRDIGVDAENLYERTTALRLARRYFTGEEARNLEALPLDQQPTRFYTLWTLKESWMKATGRGIAAGLDSAAFSLDLDHKVEGLAFAAYDASDWRFWQFAPSPEHVVAVALRAPGVARDATIQTQEWCATDIPAP
jgi:4'-phosphopantetheinyl transferase